MKRAFRHLAVVVVGALALSAPSFAAENWPDSVDAYVKQVRATVPTIDAEAYLALVKNPNGAILIDVREPEEYKAGHIPGTINIPRGFLEFRIWKQLGYPKTVDLNKKIYVQCLTGGRAILGAKQLKDVGFTNATAALVNLTEWQKKGYPLEK